MWSCPSCGPSSPRNPRCVAFSPWQRRAASVRRVSAKLPKAVHKGDLVMRNLQPAAPLSCMFVLVLASPLLAQDRPLPPSITVVGSGELSAQPDTAEVQIGVVTQAPAAADALRAHSPALDK